MEFVSKIPFFRDVTAADRNRRFGGTYCPIFRDLIYPKYGGNNISNTCVRPSIYMASYPTTKQCSYPPLLECRTSFRCNKNSQTSPLDSSLKWLNGVSGADIEFGLNRTDAGLVLHEHKRVNL